MAVALTKLYDTNTRQPKLGGDIAIVVYQANFSGNYSAGGEVIDLSADFREIYNMSWGSYGADPGGGPFNNQVYLPVPLISTAASWFLKFYEQDGAAGQLVEVAAAPYASDFRIRLTVVGRPIADAA